MNKKIIVDVQDYQTRVAILEDEELVELYIEGEGSQRIVGNIYRGKVENVLPGMQAAFVDIGLEKNAFLYVGDINTDKSVFEFPGEQKRYGKNAKEVSIGDLISRGQEITVQVLKEPIGTKGARVTTEITLPGRYLVLMPTMDYVGVSRRIEDEFERTRLKEIGEKLKPKNMGMIIRTAAEGKDQEDFANDVDFLCRLWEGIRDKEWKGKVPRILYEDDDMIYRTIRDFYTPEVKKVIINNRQEYEKTLDFGKVLFLGLRQRMEYYEDDSIGLFQYYGIESEIERAIKKKVWLKSGGYLIIEPTEALTVIDINTGKYVGTNNLEDTVLKTNLEAAKEIAHQIRLRDIGGIIIIDFIDMGKEGNRKKVQEALMNGLKKDHTKTNILGFTGLGLMEMTRKKVRSRLSSKLLKFCPHCHGTGRVYSDLMQ
ncbi:MAG TPA: Rne/Rng family ribonuclease [Clostridia bacterium]|nr:Rne/Rng family ribonuclease [Clostridia bacterium]